MNYKYKKSEVTLDETIVDFTYPKNINTVLGFESKRIWYIRLIKVLYFRKPNNYYR